MSGLNTTHACTDFQSNNHNFVDGAWFKPVPFAIAPSAFVLLFALNTCPVGP